MSSFRVASKEMHLSKQPAHPSSPLFLHCTAVPLSHSNHPDEIPESLCSELCATLVAVMAKVNSAKILQLWHLCDHVQLSFFQLNWI